MPQTPVSPLIRLTATDLIVRTGYQMGKTPVLPIYAVALGASDWFLGLIVSVSTVTGIVLKPTVGLLSDRWGRRGWLLAGTAFFAGMPFLYRFVTTPDELFAIRLVHGLATAIYGPVTFAMVAEWGGGNLGTRLGIFGMGRHGGYILGPAGGGLLLSYTDPVGVFTTIGLLSCLAFVPVLTMPSQPSSLTGRLPLREQAAHALAAAARTRAVWLAGLLEFTTFAGLYAIRTFLPLYGLGLGFRDDIVGYFFSIPEHAHLLLRAGGGRLGDWLGFRQTISAGAVLMALALFYLPDAAAPLPFVAAALVLGASQALIFPSTLALVSTQVDPDHLGAGMGAVGALKNAGKVAGPILAGYLVHRGDYTEMFHFMAALGAAVAAAVWLLGSSRTQR